jgi:tetratricopeptide (TPR) repeat protein
MSNLAKAYLAAGRTADAITLFEEALSRFEVVLGPDRPRTLESMNNLAGAYLGAERWAEAELTSRKCLDLRQRTRPDEWPRYHTMSQLGAALLGQNRYAEAEPLLVQGYEGLMAREVKIPHRERPRVPEAAYRVIALYESWGKPEQAARWRAKLRRLGVPSDLPADVFARP